jgi:hypothetical protein
VSIAVELRSKAFLTSGLAFGDESSKPKTVWRRFMRGVYFIIRSSVDSVSKIGCYMVLDINVR